MGIQDYMNRVDGPTRWKVSAAVAIFSHAAILLGGSWVMTTQAQYGMSGAVASSGGKPQIQPREETVDFEEDAPAAPARKAARPQPAPTPLQPKGTGGRVSSGALEKPAYFRNPPPPYPEQARRLKEEGLVRLAVEVDAQGNVTSVSVSKSSGFSDLDEAALDTVKNWEFKPAHLAGIAVSTSVNIPVLFRLKDAGF
ncbi:MAG: energy transducer TonB [bacterium]